MLISSLFPIPQAIDRNPLTTTPDTTLSEVIKEMHQAHANYVLILSQHHLVGIFTERDAVRLVAADNRVLAEAIANVMTRNVVSCRESEVQDILTVLSLFRQYHIRHLPILNDCEHLVGIITHESIREVLRPADLLKLRRVSDVMTTNVLCAPITTTALEVAKQMANQRVSCVVITKSTEATSSYPVGIVTESDIVRLQAQGLDYQLPVTAIMSGPLLPIQAQDSLWSAHELMQEHHIRRLVVVGELGELVGIITQTSLLQVLDPMEACVAIETLQRVVDDRTSSLKQANEQLQQEIMERKRAEEILRQQTERERLVAESAQRIRQSLDLKETLNTTVAEVRQLLQADRVLVYRLNEDGTGSVAVEAVAVGWQPIMGTKLQDACCQETDVRLYQKGHTVAITDIQTAILPQGYINLLTQFHVKANLVVPILQTDQVWGVLMVHQCSQPREWQSFEIDLLQQLATHVSIAIYQSELYQQVQYLASSDGLTHVANRRRFDECLEHEWHRLARNKSPLSLLLCDIDFFKPYNDTYGHQAGDECLKRVADAIRQAIRRPADLAARYGGEEFAVILPDTHTEGAIHVAENIRETVHALKIAHRGSQVSQYITLSIGVTTTIPSHDLFPETLITSADLGLYQAKAQGRNQIVIADYQGGCSLM